MNPQFVKWLKEQRNIGDFNSWRKLKPDDQRKLIDEFNKSQTDPKSQIKTGAYVSGTYGSGQYKADVKAPAPFFIGEMDGKNILNPVYNTSKANDIMTGALIGSQVAGQTQDPFFRMGSVLGGALVGLFTSNLGGAYDYNTEKARLEEENKQMIGNTQAGARLQTTVFRNDQIAANTEHTRVRTGIATRTFKGNILKDEKKEFFLDMNSLLNQFDQAAKGDETVFLNDSQQLNTATETLRGRLGLYYERSGDTLPDGVDLKTADLDTLVGLADRLRINPDAKPITNRGVSYVIGFDGVARGIQNPDGEILGQNRNELEIRKATDAYLDSKYAQLAEQVAPKRRAELWAQAIEEVKKSGKGLWREFRGKPTTETFKIVQDIYTGLINQEAKNMLNDEFVEVPMRNGETTRVDLPTYLGMMVGRTPEKQQASPSDAVPQTSANQFTERLPRLKSYGFTTETADPNQFWGSVRVNPEVKTELETRYLNFDIGGSGSQSSFRASYTGLNAEMTQIEADIEAEAKKPKNQQDKTKIANLTSRLAALQQLESRMRVMDSRLFSTTIPKNVSEQVTMFNYVQDRINQQINVDQNTELLGNLRKALYESKWKPPYADEGNWMPYVSSGGDFGWRAVAGQSGITDLDAKITQWLKENASFLTDEKNQGKFFPLEHEGLLNDARYAGIGITALMQDTGKVDSRNQKILRPAFILVASKRNK